MDLVVMLLLTSNRLGESHVASGLGLFSLYSGVEMGGEKWNLGQVEVEMFEEKENI